MACEIAILRTDQLMREIIEATGATHHNVFLTGEQNFRKELYPLYKAQRVQPKPMFLADCNQHLIDEWDAEVVHGMEADDVLGIEQTIAWNHPIVSNETVIASIDKDLLMIPGEHYNFVKKETYHITPFQGLYRFYSQLLTGDRVDNIPGAQVGIGPAKCAKYLEACTTEVDLFNTVKSIYDDDEKLKLHAQLLWVGRENQPYWGLLNVPGWRELFASDDTLKQSQ